VKFLRRSSKPLSDQRFVLEPVVIGKDSHLKEMLEFFMGKNTPDRQEFIIKNLKVEKDEVLESEKKEEELIAE
jgi:topoisomerase-4 subunit B